MNVIAGSVFILFVLIFLGFFIGKRGIVKKSSIPDLSNLVLMVTMPVTVFCSIVDQQGESLRSYLQIFPAILLLHAASFAVTLLVVRLMRVPAEEKGVWYFTGLLSNNGFMGLPLALSIFGSKGMFVMALANTITNLLIFSVGVIFLTRGAKEKVRLSLRQMLFNNINIAVVLGFIFLLLQIPLPSLLEDLFGYISGITSGLSMLVVGLSLSRLKVREVFGEKRMGVLVGLRLLVLPLLTILVLRLLPVRLDTMTRSIVLMTAALPSAAAQSMITEQYETNTAAAGRAVFLTTLFSVVTVPLMMAIGL